MRCYSHLSDDEREQIGLAKAVGHSIGAIAKAIGRPKSTVSRELLPGRQGRSYVGLARAEGGKKSSIACPSQQGVANHLSMAFCRERSTAHSCRRRHGL
jgi:IS30 family transposase